MGDVIHLDVPVSGNVTLDPDAILEANKGKFEELVLVGYLKDGEIAVCSTHGIRDTLFVLEKGKASLLQGDQ